MKSLPEEDWVTAKCCKRQTYFGDKEILSLGFEHIVETKNGAADRTNVRRNMTYSFWYSFLDYYSERAKE